MQPFTADRNLAEDLARKPLTATAIKIGREDDNFLAFPKDTAPMKGAVQEYMTANNVHPESGSSGPGPMYTTGTIPPLLSPLSANGKIASDIANEVAADRKRKGMPVTGTEKMKGSIGQNRLLHFSNQDSSTTRPADGLLAMTGEKGPFQGMPDTKNYHVNNSFGLHGRGEFNYKVGLNAPAATYEQTPQKRLAPYGESAARWRQQGPTTPKLPTAEAEKMRAGAIIEKEGQTMCEQGFVMQGGKCVPEANQPVCQPGWKLLNGVCVKADREFQSGADQGMVAQSQQQAVKQDQKLANEFLDKYQKPLKQLETTNALSVNQLRRYTQELNTGVGETTTPPANDSVLGYQMPFIGLLVVIFLLVFGMVYMRRR